MGQLYMQRFKYRGAIDKAAYDAAWGVAFQAKATTGNWGNVANGITHHKAWGTAWGGYSLIEAEPPRGIAGIPGVSRDELRAHGDRHLRTTDRP